MMCECKRRGEVHPWEPGEWCSPERVPPVEMLVEPKLPAGDPAGQAERYAEALGLEEAAVTALPKPRRFGHMGVAIVGGYIWPGWSRSREIFPIEPYEPSAITGADILRGQELVTENGWV